MLQTTINLYSFNELNEDAKQNAIYTHRDFLESMPVECEDEDGNMIDEYLEYSDDDVIENIEANEYIYFNNGKLASCTTYTGEHEKAGITEFRLYGDTYVLSTK